MNTVKWYYEQCKCKCGRKFSEWVPETLAPRRSKHGQDKPNRVECDRCAQARMTTDAWAEYCRVHNLLVKRCEAT